MLSTKQMLATVVGMLAVANALTVETPPTIQTCVPVAITWSGGTAPYYLSIIPGGQTTAASLIDFGTFTTTSYTWTDSTIAAGTVVTIKLTDSTGVTVYSAEDTILSGSTSCFNSTASASTQTTTGTGAGAVATTASSAAVSSILSSASAAASSASAAGSSSSSLPSSAAAATSTTTKAASTTTAAASTSTATAAATTSAAATSAAAASSSAASGAKATGVAAFWPAAVALVGGAAALF